MQSTSLMPAIGNPLRISQLNEGRLPKIELIRESSYYCISSGGSSSWSRKIALQGSDLQEI
jgi:hypothetical protein